MYVKYFYAFPFPEHSNLTSTLPRNITSGFICYYLLLCVIQFHCFFYSMPTHFNCIFILKKIHYAAKCLIDSYTKVWIFYSVGDLWPHEKVIHLIMILLRNIILCWALSCELCFGSKILFIELLHTFLFFRLLQKYFLKLFCAYYELIWFSIFSKICNFK